MNVIARLEYELAYCDSAVNRFNHYTTRTPPEFHFSIFENVGFSFSDYITLSTHFLYGETSCVMCSLNLEKVNFYFFVYYLLLILLLYFPWSKFFDILLNCSGLFLLYIETYAKSCLLLCVLGVCSLFNGIFSANSYPFFLSVVG